MNINSIFNYTDTLLSQWVDWHKDILVGNFRHDASSWTEALGANSSNSRTRASELFRLGMTTVSLTKKTTALDKIKSGENVQSRLGYLSALIYQGYQISSTKTLIKSIAALDAIFSVIQPVNLDTYIVSINTVMCRLLEAFPVLPGYNKLTWMRYLLSGFCCKINNAPEDIPLFIKGEKKTIFLQIIKHTKESNRYIDEIRCGFGNSTELKKAIDDGVSLTNIYQQKLPLFLIGNPDEKDPRGYYGMADKYFESFLNACFVIESKHITNSPFKNLYIEEGENCQKGNIIEILYHLSHQYKELETTFANVMKTIIDGAVEALSFITGKPQSDFIKIEGAKTEKDNIQNYLSALRTKPFMLLAGISGTGKSRIVRKLAQSTVPVDLQKAVGYEGTDFAKDRWTLHAPVNFELIQVKPNWHNSMDVIGYLSNIPTPHYVFTPFVEFIVKAWKYPNVPFFLCLDEMNLAPVEEYFAEFLSAIESRSFEGAEYVTDPIIKPFNSFGIEVAKEMVNTLFPNFKAGDTDSSDSVIINHFRTKGLTLPKNLIVIGTVNMDETTFSFSRKVLDRAMSVEMNEVNYDSFLSNTTDDDIKTIVKGFEEGKYGKGVTLNALLVDRHIEAKEIKNELGNDAQFVIQYLKRVNALLEGTPFKLGYRAANEALIYLRAAQEFGQPNRVVALDNFTLMKILSRIEGDENKLRITSSDSDKERLNLSEVDAEQAKVYGDLNVLTALRNIITQLLGEYYQTEEEQSKPEEGAKPEEQIEDDATQKIEKKRGERLKSIKKIDNMLSQLKRDHFVSYWN